MLSVQALLNVELLDGLCSFVSALVRLPGWTRLSAIFSDKLGCKLDSLYRCSGRSSSKTGKVLCLLS